jgi:hypothetical protein
VFPQGYLTPLELEIWGKYYDELKKEKENG